MVLFGAKPTRWCPSSLAKLVYNSNNYMVYGTCNYSYWGESKPTYNWGAPHCTIWSFNIAMENPNPK